MAKSLPKKNITIALAAIGLAIDLLKAAEHRQTCPECRTRDFLTIALDVGHLFQVA